MPLLSIEQVEDLLKVAALHRTCNVCGHRTAMDYCRTCDEFFWHHLPGCAMYEDKHFGHRLYLTPFVEDWTK
jgi:ribosomal 30S subunit maturation factor RimM